MVEIEAAQKILVGFALAGMLGDDQAGHDFKRLAGAREGHGVHLRAADVMALAAVGCRYAGAAVADPGVTPLATCGGTGAVG